ncbi:MAG TPA: SDR family oxidoreductase, partial [Acidimicrobiia bacterium]|nr:SDR family oxidoreductase [Acidimicrobiia bacterium]
GKRALVVGGATGMGGATVPILADLGAEIVVMDYADVSYPDAKAVRVDLRDKANIDEALAQCDGPFAAVLCCAGVADGTPGIEKVNFIGHRHLIDRLLESGGLTRGSAIGMISSAAGLGWEANLDLLKEYLATPDFDTAAAWIAAHPERADYMWSKQAINAYVAQQAFPLLKRGIRINAILPGPTDTPLARANEDVWLGFGQDYRADAGIEASTPEEQAYPLVFLCSDAARYITGQTLVTDAGYIASGITESYPAAKPAADFLRGKL